MTLRLLNLVAVLSLLLCVGVGALWAVARRHVAVAHWMMGNRNLCQVRAEGGRAQAVMLSGWPAMERLSYSYHPRNPAREPAMIQLKYFGGGSRWARLGVFAETGDCVAEVMPNGSVRRRRFSDHYWGDRDTGKMSYFLVHVPIPLIMAALMTPSVVVFVGRSCGGWVRRRKRRLAGLCPACGYDLRATPGQCPECGAEPASVPHTMG